MKKQILPACALLSIVVSCNKTNLNEPPPLQSEPLTITLELSPEESDRMALLHTSYAVSAQDVLQYAEGVANMAAKEEISTKGTSKNRVPVLIDSMVTEYTPTTTKGGSSEAEQAKVYVVSLGTDAGFAVIAGDKRGGGVLAFSDSGTYDPQSVPPVVKYSLQCMANYVASEIERCETMRGDSLYNEMADKYGVIGPRNATKAKMWVWNGIEYVEMEIDNVTSSVDHYELETTSKNIMVTANWGQDYPYNQYIVNSHMGHYRPAGCVATAVAQIMSYHKVGSYGGETFAWNQFPSSNWSSVSQDVTNSVSNLFWYLGRPANLDMQYTPTISTANSQNVGRTLTNFGYNSSRTLDPYSYGPISSEMSSNRPAYMQGTDQTTNGVHAWIVDGVQLDTHWEVWKTEYWYQGQVKAVVYEKRYPTYLAPYVHINWGWNGYLNCWNRPDVFNTYGSGDYSTKNYMIIGIKPR